MSIFFDLILNTQQVLFPALEAEVCEPLSPRHQLFVTTVELTRPESFMQQFRWTGVGRPRALRVSILLGFIAKAVWNFPTTRALLDRLAHDRTLRRLCGWEKASDVPTEATFSRAFAQFAASALPQRLHEALIKAAYQEKLVGHLSRDSTPIAGREKPLGRVPQSLSKPKAKRGRPRKGEVRQPKPRPVVERQLEQTLQQNVAMLPVQCDVGCKNDSHGRPKRWAGYKLHLDVADGDVPVSALLSAASMHDSQAAIPLAQISAQRVLSLYDLMDSAYDSPAIHRFSALLGHVAIIDPNRRRKAQAPHLSPAQAQRYRQRTSAERVNSDVKDNHGGSCVRVRGACKVMAHLMLGVLVVAVKGLCRMLE